MGEIAIRLGAGEAPLPRTLGEGVTHRRFEVIGGNGPGWRIADLYEGSTIGDITGAELAGTSEAPNPLWLRARPHGPGVGSQPEGPVATWLVLVNPTLGKEDAFNDWYDTQHIHDSLAVPGFVSGQRYVVLAASQMPPRWAHLTLYQIELDRVAESLAEAVARAGTPRMPNPGMLAPGTTAVTLRPVD